MTVSIDISLSASFFRAGIVHAVLDGGEVVAWADRVILLLPDPPAAIYDVSLAPAADRIALLAALAPLTANAEPSERVARGLLGVIASRLAADSLSPAKAIAVGYTILRGAEVPDTLRDQAMMLDEDYSLAEDRIFGSTAEMGVAIRFWFAQFAGAQIGLVSPAG
jgi:hypothetical protein